MSYLLDANVFIQAKNLHYGLDFCPAFWQWLIDGHADGRVFSIDKVADEIAAGADELTQWMHDHGNGLFRKTDAAVAAQFGRQIRQVIEETLTEFGLEDADIKAVDKGARDCTIRARVTAAAVRATGKDVWA